MDINMDDPVAFRREVAHFERLLALARAQFGPEDPRSLAFANNLAIGYDAVGRVDEAIRLDEETLRVRERVLGPEHPDTLSSHSNLAIGYVAVGRTAEAAKLEETSSTS